MSGELPEERWLPTQTVTTILLSIISLLSAPNTSSPANVDASVCISHLFLFPNIACISRDTFHASLRFNDSHKSLSFIMPLSFTLSFIRPSPTKLLITLIRARHSRYHHPFASFIRYRAYHALIILHARYRRSLSLITPSLFTPSLFTSIIYYLHSSYVFMTSRAHDSCALYSRTHSFTLCKLTNKLLATQTLKMLLGNTTVNYSILFIEPSTYGNSVHSFPKFHFHVKQ